MGEMLREVTPPACHSFSDGLAECLSAVQSCALKEVTRLEALVDDLRAQNMYLAEQLESTSLRRGTPVNLQADEEAGNTHTEAASGHTIENNLSMVPQTGLANPRNDASLSLKDPSESEEPKKKWLSEAVKTKVKAMNKRSSKTARRLYKDDGWAQQVAKSNWFEMVSLGVICINAIWISIDLDFNTADSMLTADHVFVFMDNFFCVFFTLEFMVRFAALRKKFRCILEPWFIFDGMLVIAMVAETWIVTFVLLVTGASSLQGMSSMSVLRMLRLLRLTRMAKMMRAWPEVMILVTGLKSSIRSVVVTLIMLVFVTYVFAIVLKQLTLNSTLGDEFYKSVPLSMATLFFETVVPDNATMLHELFMEAWYLPIIFFMFIGLSALVFMNMIVGFLCDVVSTVTAEEKEAAEIEMMTENLHETIKALDTNYDGLMSHSEVSCLLDNTGAVQSMQRIGVDVLALVQELDFFVKDEGMPFDDFVEVVLQFRTTQAATVGVIAALRKSIDQAIQQIADSVGRIESKLSSRPDAHFSL